MPNDEQQKKPAAAYWYATRKRDRAACIVWVQGTGPGRRVSCARTQREVSIDDFYMLGLVPPFSTPVSIDNFT